MTYANNPNPKNGIYARVHFTTPLYKSDYEMFLLALIGKEAIARKRC